MFKGIPASPGIVIGSAYVLNKKTAEFKEQKITAADIEAEMLRLRRAVEKTKLDVLAIKEKVQYDIGTGEADIFNAYLIMLEDQMFAGKADNIIKESLVNAETALNRILREYTEFFNKISDSYLKERGRDISGLVEKITRNLTESVNMEPDNVSDRYIVVSHDLSPADTAEMDKERVLGFVTEIGGATSLLLS